MSEIMGCPFLQVLLVMQSDIICLFLFALSGKIFFRQFYNGTGKQE